MLKESLSQNELEKETNQELRQKLESLEQANAILLDENGGLKTKLAESQHLATHAQQLQEDYEKC